MPYIEVKTTKKATNEQESTLFVALGKAIELLPGKTEEWLMLNVEGDKHMAFRGRTDEDMAYITVALVGKAGAENYEKLTKRLCELCEEILGIAPDHVYVKYEEVDYWGWNNMNF